MVSNREQELNRKLVIERRVLFACTVMIGLSVILWAVAIGTDWWFTVSGGPNGIYMNETKRFFLHINSGLWRTCRTSYGNTTVGGGANVTSSPVMTSGNTTVNVTFQTTIYKYNRVEASFSIISLLLMILGLSFSVYTFWNTRYMFKRLAAGIYFLAGVCVQTVIQVLIRSFDYEKKHLPMFPRDATYSYGFSFFLAWLVFIMLLVSSVAFLIYSRKRKGNKAPNEEIAMADEPTIIGR